MTTPKEDKPVYIPATLEDVARDVHAIRKAIDKPNEAMRELGEMSWLEDIEDRLANVQGRQILGLQFRPGQLAELLDDIPLLVGKIRELESASTECTRCSGEGVIERQATPEEVDNGCELGIAVDPCPVCQASPITHSPSQMLEERLNG